MSYEFYIDDDSGWHVEGSFYVKEIGIESPVITKIKDFHTPVKSDIPDTPYNLIIEKEFFSNYPNHYLLIKYTVTEEDSMNYPYGGPAFFDSTDPSIDLDSDGFVTLGELFTPEQINMNFMSCYSTLDPQLNIGTQNFPIYQNENHYIRFEIQNPNLQKVRGLG